MNAMFDALQKTSTDVHSEELIKTNYPCDKQPCALEHNQPIRLHWRGLNLSAATVLFLKFVIDWGCVFLNNANNALNMYEHRSVKYDVFEKQGIFGRAQSLMSTNGLFLMLS